MTLDIHEFDICSLLTTTKVDLTSCICGDSQVEYKVYMYALWQGSNAWPPGPQPRSETATMFYTALLFFLTLYNNNLLLIVQIQISTDGI